MKNTKEVNDYLTNLTPTSTPHPICQARTIYCLNWYSRKSVFYKTLYYILSIINIIVPLLSSILVITSDEQDMIAAILSSLVSFSASMLSLYCAKDKWTNYRTVAEFIKSHYVLYLSKSAPYHDNNRDSLYLNTIEAKMENVHMHWVNVQNNTNSSNI